MLLFGIPCRGDGFSIDLNIKSEIFSIAGGDRTWRIRLYVDHLIVNEGDFAFLHHGHRIVVSAKGAGWGQADARGRNLGRSACCTGGLFWIAAGRDRGGKGNSQKIFFVIK